jgi:O-acetyl-ADP-ribose deacetylase (regulator of RNase III)
VGTLRALVSDMIKQVSGDILLSDARAIAHGVAANDHFDNGLALTLRERFPALVRDFRHFCQSHHPKPGSVWGWITPDGVRIYSLLTQEPAAGGGNHAHGHPGKATLPYVNHALRALRAELLTEQVASVALPRLATGVGGLDWAAVEPLIREHLGGGEMKVFVYDSYVKGQKATE